MERTDAELVEELTELAQLMPTDGLEGIKAEIAQEDEDEDQLFFRLLTNDGKVLETANMKYWGSLNFSTRPFENNGDYALTTLKSDSYEHKVRLISGVISSVAVVQIGLSLEENDEYLAVFRDLFSFMLIPLIVLAALVGWFMSRRALFGVEEITRTAKDITKGDYDKRVHVKKRSYEIDRLAETFNSMLDRIQALLKGMRDMTDNIAHDLRSPLARIRGIAEMTLISKKPIDDYQEMAANTVEECDNLIAMIDTMLDITETEAGVGELKLEEINLTHLISEACELFRPLGIEKGINIIVNLPEKLYLHGDRNKLQRLVTNLLENAIKYTSSNGTVTVSARANEGKTCIIFEDTGIGISKDDLPRIFERFYRTDTSRTQSGTGLGLSLARAIAKALGGNITVNSILKKGSIFTVTMPQLSPMH
jgi:signal transduction histidine kinase